MRPYLFAMLLMTSATAGPALAACGSEIEPVISLDHGSRYQVDSKTRSDIDEVSNDEVNEALEPIDDFIREIVASANDAAEGNGDPFKTANCVVSAIYRWAKADALSELDTVNANLSAPSRIGGIAFAYAQVAPMSEMTKEKAEIESWLGERARAAIAFFDTEAPPKASRNNLRAWAALAVARIGLTLEDEVLLHWAAYSTALVACSADEDGSLPLEMGRGKYALHYQLHAVAALIPTAALLEEAGMDIFTVCDNALQRAARFAVEGLTDRELVEAKTGNEQTYFNGTEKVESFELAWAEAYLSRFNDPEVAAYVDPFRPLSHSKLGGLQSLVWKDSSH
jgi:poly(beta-D-mannuronate) lyase